MIDDYSLYKKLKQCLSIVLENFSLKNDKVRTEEVVQTALDSVFCKTGKTSSDAGNTMLQKRKLDTEWSTENKKAREGNLEKHTFSNNEEVPENVTGSEDSEADSNIFMPTQSQTHTNKKGNPQAKVNNSDSNAISHRGKSKNKKSWKS